MSDGARRFFDELGAGYTAAIERCVPRYREMLAALLDAVPSRLAPRRIVELGCGTGNLTTVMLSAFPAADVEAVDLSGELLEECRQRLADRPRLRTLQADMRTLHREPGADDLVVSSIALHHLTDAEKRDLFRALFVGLRPGGALVFADQCAGATDDVTRRHQERWREACRERGVPDDEWNEWMRHQELHDHHASLPWHLEALREAGFGPVDCPWRHLLWTVIVAERPA